MPYPEGKQKCNMPICKQLIYGIQFNGSFHFLALSFAGFKAAALQWRWEGREESREDEGMVRERKGGNGSGWEVNERERLGLCTIAQIPVTAHVRVPQQSHYTDTDY